MLTLEQVQAEFSKHESRPRKTPVGNKSAKEHQLLSTLCFIHRLTPAQLAELPVERVRVLLSDLSKISVKSEHLKRAIESFVKGQSSA